MRSDKKGPLKSDKKSPSKIQKRGSLGYSKKSALLEDAITQMNAGKYSRASSVLKDLLALDPLNAEARRLFATLHLRLGSLMSARTAFESLAREALERQDYWLAESLLREYLTAGPRCVPFLEMLGQLYEGKGDVMAAVAEYGKAVEVLLEDPDTDRPNRASELFAKIRSLAPGSPVAFRLSAMFDTVTGQMVQAPQKDTADAEAESPDTSMGIAAAADSSLSPAMPWEEIEPASSDSAISPEVGTSMIEGPVGNVEAMPSSLGPNSEPAIKVPTQDTWSGAPMPPEFPLDVVSQTAQAEEVSRQGTAVQDSALPPPTVVEDPKAGLDALTEASNYPAVDKPARTNLSSVAQVDEVSLAIGGGLAAELADSPEKSSMPAAQEGPAAPLFATGGSTSMEVALEERKRDLPEQAAANSGTTPELAPGHANQAEFDSAGTPGSKGEIHAASEAPTDFMPPFSESLSSTIEVLKTSSAHPIAEPPRSPAAMPWDQVQEVQEALSSSAEVPEPVTEKAQEPPAPSALAPSIEAAAPPDPPAAFSSSFTSSLGLSWEDILAAVAAMQASPPYPTSSLTEGGVTTGGVSPAEISTPPEDALEIGGLAPAAPITGSIGNLPVDSVPPLSAPMPWEQVEVEELTILRPDPEPEFGLRSTDVPNGEDCTPLMLPAEQAYQSEPASDSDSRTLSPDPPAKLLSDQISVETVKPLASVDLVAESDAPVGTALVPGSVVDREDQFLPDERMEGTAPRETELSQATFVGACAEADGVAIPEAVPIPPHEGEGTDDFRGQVESYLVHPPSELERPLALVNSEKAEPATPEQMTQSAVPSDEGSSVVDQPVIQPDAPDDVAEAVSTVEDIESVAEANSPSLLVQEQVEGCEAVDSLAPRSSSNDPLDRWPNEPASISSDRIDSPFSTAPVAHPSDVIHQPVAEASIPASNETPSIEPAAEQAAPTPVTDAPPERGIRILWNDSFAKRASNGSTGNMLTRWFKKAPDSEAVDAGQPMTGRDSESSPPATVPEAPQESTTQSENPIDRLVGAAPHPIEPHRSRSYPRKPVVPAWHRITEIVSSFIGAGVSTTRSIIVLAGALLTLALVCLAGSLGLIVVAWLVLEEQPSPSYRTMTTEPQQALGDSQKNGYFVLLGFDAAPALDPVEVGMDRRAEKPDRAAVRGCMSGEGHGPGGQGASGEVLGQWLKASDPAAHMRAESAGVKSWVSQAGVGMGRYRQWLSKPFDDRGFGLMISPNCGAILYAHRLYVAEGFAQDMDRAEKLASRQPPLGYPPMTALMRR